MVGDDGQYAFSGLADGTYVVRIVAEPGRKLTTPAGGAFEVTIDASRPVASARDFGSIAGLDLVLTIPEDAGAGAWTLGRVGNRLVVRDRDLGIVEARPLADVWSLTIVGASGRANSLTIDMASGGFFALPGGTTSGGPGRGRPRLAFRLGHGMDLVAIDGDLGRDQRAARTVPGRSVEPERRDGEGRRPVVVSGRPVTPAGRVELRGGPGDDVYDLAAFATRIMIVDESGIDPLDFHRSAAGVRIDLSRDGGRWQSVDRLDNLVSLTGGIENVRGTDHADVLIGDAAANILLGRGGPDPDRTRGRRCAHRRHRPGSPLWRTRR